MPKDNRENILLDYAFISMISPKIRVIIIGGGKAGYIKAKSFLKRGYIVSVVSGEFDQRILELMDNDNKNGRLNLIRDCYDEKYIKKMHLVIIATDDKNLNQKIKEDCEKYVKIYLYAESFREGQFVTPIELETDNIKVGIHTTVGSPKTSLFLKEKIYDCISEYDDFVNYIGQLRVHIIEKTCNRKLNLEVMNFVNTDDFYFFYRNNKHELILKLFWRDEFDF